MQHSHVCHDQSIGDGGAYPTGTHEDFPLLRKFLRVAVLSHSSVPMPCFINPHHPNLTIWGNQIEAALFIDIHCHYANLGLRIVRAEANCLTVTHRHDIHEGAMLSVQDVDQPLQSIR